MLFLKDQWIFDQYPYNIRQNIIKFCSCRLLPGSSFLWSSLVWIFDLNLMKRFRNSCTHMYGVILSVLMYPKSLSYWITLSYCPNSVFCNFIVSFLKTFAIRRHWWSRDHQIDFRRIRDKAEGIYHHITSAANSSRCSSPYIYIYAGNRVVVNDVMKRVYLFQTVIGMRPLKLYVTTPAQSPYFLVLLQIWKMLLLFTK
jgi:hypothetical protein